MKPAIGIALPEECPSADCAGVYPDRYDTCERASVSKESGAMGLNKSEVHLGLKEALIMIRRSSLLCMNWPESHSCAAKPSRSDAGPDISMQDTSMRNVLVPDMASAPRLGSPRRLIAAGGIEKWSYHTKPHTAIKLVAAILAVSLVMNQWPYVV